MMRASRSRDRAAWDDAARDDAARDDAARDRSHLAGQLRPSLAGAQRSDRGRSRRRMARFDAPVVAAALLLLLAACSRAPIPAEDLLVRVDVPTREVAFGRAFDLAVVRVWSKDFAPDRFDPRSLAPLELRADGADRREDGDRVEETLRFRAYAFAPDDLTVPGATLRARPLTGGAPRAVVSEPFALRVLPALRTEDSRDPESPTTLELPVSPTRVFALVAVLAAAISLLAYLRLRAAARRPSRAAAGPSPAARLAALHPPSDADPAALDAFYIELSSAVRDHLDRAHGVPAPRLTTEELRRDPTHAERLGPARRDAAADLLAGCDRAKFARAAAEEDAARRLSEAGALVADAAPSDAPRKEAP
jgi:hypothetical protein